MARVPALELLGGPPPEDSAVVRARIAAARARSLARNDGHPNAALTGSAVVRLCALAPAVKSRLAELAASRKLSARGVHRVLRVARSIADLAGHTEAAEADVLAAAALREPIGSVGDLRAA